jgi:hypothetical protein
VKATLTRMAHHAAMAAGVIPGKPARTVSHFAALLQARIPVTVDAIRSELGNLDGYPTTASGSDQGPRSKGTISKPTERIAVTRLLERDDGRQGPAADLDDLWNYTHTALTLVLRGDDDSLHAALVAVHCAHKICDRHQAPADPRTPRNLRCSGTGGAAGATCENIADYRIRPDGSVDDMDHRCGSCRVLKAEQDEVERMERDAARKRKAARRGAA